MAIKYVYQHRPLKDPPKFTQIGIFGLKICRLATVTKRTSKIKGDTTPIFFAASVSSTTSDISNRRRRLIDFWMLGQQKTRQQLAAIRSFRVAPFLHRSALPF
jgi:hypothetical protein